MKDVNIKVTVDLSPAAAALLSRLADGLENLVTGGPVEVINAPTCRTGPATPCCGDTENHCQEERWTDASEHPVGCDTTHLEPPAPQPEVDPTANPEPATTEPEAPKAKPIDFESFRGRVAKYLASGGDKAALRDYLTEKFGSGQVSAVPEDKRAEVLAHLGV